jgi:phenylalanyl-tRNA synthetase alpha chain
MTASVQNQLDALKSEALDAIANAADLDAIEQIRIHYLGRKGGKINGVSRSVGQAPPEERPALGQAANALKSAITDALDAKKSELEQAQRSAASGGALDVTLPGRRPHLGHQHPITQTYEEIVDIFSEMGFQVAAGPEVETEYYNFDSLNTPEDHPARDSHDTFFVKPGVVLRTHTSPCQMRVMEKVQPPLAVVVPGRVYRIDQDSTHSPMFHQVEGLLVDEGVTFADLKGTLSHFVHRFFGPNIAMRFRPHFFPFTEPSAELDVAWTITDADGNERTQWLEILGCGMVHPEVFRHANYDYERYSGYAFGMGVDRLAMIRHKINSIHYLYEGDLRFLEQF